jgi:hypothetical protein
VIVMPMILHRKRLVNSIGPSGQVVRYTCHNQYHFPFPTSRELKPRLLLHHASLLQSGVGGRAKRLHCPSALIASLISEPVTLCLTWEPTIRQTIAFTRSSDCHEDAPDACYEEDL